MAFSWKLSPTPTGPLQLPPRQRPRAAALHAAAGSGLLLLLALAGCAGTASPSAVPMVTVIAPAAALTEGEPLNLGIRAEPAPRTDLTVAVTITYGGCALQQSSLSVTIPAGDSRTMLAVPTAGAAGCTVTAAIAAGEGYRAATAADASVSVLVTAVTVQPEAPPTVVTIAADQLTVVEGDDLSFTLTAAPPPISDLTVAVTWSESGSFLTEPGPLTVEVTIPASGTATLRAATDDDSADEPDGEVTATIVDGSGYKIGTDHSVTVAVTDNDASTTAGTPPKPAPTEQPCRIIDINGTVDCPLVSIRADASSVTEGNPASFTLTSDRVPESAITVSLNWLYSPSRIVGTPPATATFDAGSSTASVTIQTVDDGEPGGGFDLRVFVSDDLASSSNRYYLTGPPAVVEVQDAG